MTKIINDAHTPVNTNKTNTANAIKAIEMNNISPPI